MQTLKWTVAALLLLTAGCKSFHVSSSQDKSADFSRYQSFNFKESGVASNPPGFDQAALEKVKAAIRREIEARDYVFSDKPDLLVTTYVRLAEKTYDRAAPAPETGSLSYNMQKYYGFYYGYDRSMVQSGQDNYREGTLLIDVVDAKQQRLVWQGVVVGVIYSNRTEAQQEERMREAMRAVFKRFPARASGA